MPGGSFLERGSPSDILEFTREQIFDEILRLRDDERERIGHELHDSAGQLLLFLQLSVARLKLHEEAKSYEGLIEEIQETARLISAEVRSLAYLNHPAELAPSGLASTLRGLLEGFGKRTGFHVSFHSAGDLPPIDADTSMALLRVAQEALVNIHRHAHAQAVTMSLEIRGNKLELTITDDGVGMPSAELLAIEGGVGVQGMRFRVKRLGGEFRICNLERGTRISAAVPVRQS